MLAVTTGGWEEYHSPRGINGPIDDLLFPINHGILHYPEYDALPPFVAYRVDRLDEAGLEVIAERLRERMRMNMTAKPISCHRQNGSDYLIPTLELRPGVRAEDIKGFALHRSKNGQNK